MINVAAIRMQQFGVQFYQASLTASDIDKLVRFEVLNYGDTAQPPVRGGKARAGDGVVGGALRIGGRPAFCFAQALLRRKLCCST